jgi:hypothetical protein
VKHPITHNKKGPSPCVLLLCHRLACAALGGCAIVVNPGNDGDVQVRTPFNGKDGRRHGVARARAAHGRHRARDWTSAVPIVVDVRVGPATSLVVEADSNLLPLIRTDVRGDKLNIETERSYRSRNPVRVTYTVPRLTDLRHERFGPAVGAGPERRAADGAPRGSGAMC